jgi:hypothetical protein
MLRVLFCAAFLAAPACMGPDDVAARVSWIEAAWLPGGIELNVRGTAGCGRLTGMGLYSAWRVDSSAVFVTVEPRGSIAGTNCPQATMFDTTFVVTLVLPSHATSAYVIADNRSHIVADSRDSTVARWFGGRASVIVPPGCRFLQLSEGYAFDSIPGVPLGHGTRLFVRGSLAVTPTLGCTTEPRATLTHFETIPIGSSD